MRCARHHDTSTMRPNCLKQFWPHRRTPATVRVPPQGLGPCKVFLFIWRGPGKHSAPFSVRFQTNFRSLWGRCRSGNAVGIWRQLLMTLQNLSPDPATPSESGARFCNHVTIWLKIPRLFRYLAPDSDGVTESDPRSC